MSQWGIYCVPGPGARACANTRRCHRRTKKLDAVVLQSAKRASGQTSQERAPHSSPPSRRKSHYISLCTLQKKKKKRKKRNRHRVSSFLLDEQNPRLGSAVIFSCCVLGFNHGEGHGTACVPHITSFHHRGSRMLRERQETGPEALVSPLV